MSNTLSTDLPDLAYWIKRAWQSESRYDVAIFESRQTVFTKWSVKSAWPSASLLSKESALRLRNHRRITHTLPRRPLWHDLSMCLSKVEIIVCHAFSEVCMTRKTGMVSGVGHRDFVPKKREINNNNACQVLTVRRLEQQDYFIRGKVTATTNCNYSDAIPVMCW